MRSRTDIVVIMVFVAVGDDEDSGILAMTMMVCSFDDHPNWKMVLMTIDDDDDD